MFVRLSLPMDPTQNHPISLVTKPILNPEPFYPISSLKERATLQESVTVHYAHLCRSHWHWQPFLLGTGDELDWLADTGFTCTCPDDS